MKQLLCMASVALLVLAGGGMSSQPLTALFVIAVATITLGVQFAALERAQEDFADTINRLAHLPNGVLVKNLMPEGINRTVYVLDEYGIRMVVEHGSAIFGGREAVILEVEKGLNGEEAE